MITSIDLEVLSQRESEQIEWKENVADIDDVIKSLCAFANDLANLGGGYVVCGAQEQKDEFGFSKISKIGLTAAALAELKGRVLTRCRERVTPEIMPAVYEVESENKDRRILIFVQPATSQAHQFRNRQDETHFFIRDSRSTIQARNGLLRELLVRKGSLEPWDRRICSNATIDDIDLLTLRDALQQMKLFSAEKGIEQFLSEQPISAFVPSLCQKEPLTGILRPRNFAILLFGRSPQKFFAGTYCLFSIYPGEDRADPHSERHEVSGNLLDQARQLKQLLNVESFTVFDKSDINSPNIVKYPNRALYEALGNTLAHRDYELAEPVRITVFSNRIEFISPGPLPLGIDPIAFREGRARPKWRNQALAWFFNKLQIAQGEGQGIPTILRTMRDEGCPDPTLDPSIDSVRCVLPAHPRHAVLRDLREAEKSMAIGDYQTALRQINSVIERDSLNHRAVRLFAETQYLLRNPYPVRDYILLNSDKIEKLPASVILQLAESLMISGHNDSQIQYMARKLLNIAAKGKLEQSEIRRVVTALIRDRNGKEALQVIDYHLTSHPELSKNASILQLTGNALIDLAKKCLYTAKRNESPHRLRENAWNEFDRYLNEAEKNLSQAQMQNPEPDLALLIERNLDFLVNLRRNNQPRNPNTKYNR
jgi:ATP-dependent DNA helicase RecG